jgi:hypothetical protein
MENNKTPDQPFYQYARLEKEPTREDVINALEEGKNRVNKEVSEEVLVDKLRAMYLLERSNLSTLELMVKAVKSETTSLREDLRDFCLVVNESPLATTEWFQKMKEKYYKG